MRSKYVVLSSIAAGSLAVTGIGVGTSVAASSAPTPHTITFKSKTVVSKSVGKNKSIDADKNTAHGKFLGTDVVTFTFKHNVAKGKVAAAFKGGFIYGKFNATQTGAISGKITGGTGKYKDVTGTITGQSAGKNTEKVTITYQ
jgi:hypothetical protein